MKDYEKVYEEFWKELVTHDDGSINMDAIKRELFDFYITIQEVSKTYDAITGGKLSKPNTDSSYIIDAVAEYYNDFAHKDCNNFTIGSIINTPFGYGAIVGFDMPCNGLFYEPQNTNITIWYGTNNVFNPSFQSNPWVSKTFKVQELLTLNNITLSLDHQIPNDRNDND